jgi:ribosomal protein L2
VTISHPPGGGRGRQQLNQQIRTPVAFSVKKIYNKRKAKETIVNKAGKQRILFVVFI